MIEESDVMMKKICLIAPSLQMGGIERSMSVLANFFVKQDFDVYYVSIFPFEHFFFLDERVQYFEPNVKHINKANVFRRTIYYLKIFFPHYGYLSKIIKRIGPDIVMSFGDWYPHLAMLSLHGKYPFYYANRSNPAIRYSWEFEVVRKLAYKLYPPVGVIAQTVRAKERKEQIFGMGKMRIKVIPNPVRRIELTPSVIRENYVISVGRMYWSKGFGRVIDVFARLNAPDWKLVLIGDGEDLEDIREKVQNLGLVDRVIFTGKVKNVDDWLVRSSIYLMGSYNEGFPNALCEAMSAGLACVSYDIIAGPSDIIEDGINGYLVPDGNVEEMVQRTQFLIDHPEERSQLSKNAQCISDKLSLEHIGNMYVDFILSNAD